MASGAVAGAAVYGATDMLTGGSAAASASTDQAAVLTGGTALVIDGASVPQVSELTPFRDPLRIPPTLRPAGTGITKVRLTEKSVRLHSQLPPTPMWTYEGHYPGPTIEARSRQRIRIAWTNELHGASPVRGVFVSPAGPPPGLLPSNSPGAQGAPVRPEIAALTAWTTVHLHGGHHHAINDGMPDSAITHGSAQLSEYPNDAAAAQLFYHDHAMPVTAINVMAGLIGTYFIRDSAEDRLDLPRGRYEMPLMISDVNFDTDAKGLINGRLLAKRVSAAKATPGVMPSAIGFIGPYTMVNGVVWPYLEVEARAYRFRMVNVSLSRTYALVVLDEATGKPVGGAMRLIGTDMGLLGEPKVIDEVVSISPGERLDFVIDFAAFAGRRLRLVNTVPGVPAGTPAPAATVPHPEVMQFRVAGGKNAAYSPPRKLASDFKQLTAADLPKGTVERFVMLVLNAQRMATILELQEVAANVPPANGIVQLALPGGTRTFRSVASHFEDSTTFFAASDSWERWTFISVAPAQTRIMHPMHIHLMKFQLLERHAVDGSGYDSALGRTTTPITIKDAVPISPGESGWKDTVAVPANSMVTLAGRFGAQTGRFMYHCHILDHEDEGMMRPFVVMPPKVLDIQNMMMAMMNGTGPMTPMGHGPDGMTHP